MRRENRGSRPGGDRAPRGQRPGNDRSARSPRPGGKRFERGSGSEGARPDRPGTPGGRPDRVFGREGERSGQRPSFGDRPQGRSGFRRDNDSNFGESRNTGRSRFGGESGYKQQRPQNDRFEGGRRNDSGSKKIVLQKDRRPSKGQLLKELGYADHKSYRESTRRGANVVPEIKSDLIRLNRFISNSGICSRREADKYIAAGVVVVNGKVVSELGAKVSPNDEVRFDGRLITPERKVYLLLNKPKDFVTTTDDPHATQTVMDLIKNACEERIYPVGRLDRNTTGLLLFTNDGDLAKRLSHPSHKVEKVYQVTLDKNVSVNDIQKIADGIELEDGFIAADGITYVEGMEKNVVGIEIHSGRNRIVRRIFEQLGYRIRGLDRVSYAGLTKKNLPRGKWRFLSPPEVSFLKMK